MLCKKLEKNQRRFYIQQQRKKSESRKSQTFENYYYLSFFSVSCHCQNQKILIKLSVTCHHHHQSVSQSVSKCDDDWLAGWLAAMMDTFRCENNCCCWCWYRHTLIFLFCLKKIFMLFHISNMKQMLWMKQTARIHFHYFQQKIFSIKNGHHRIKNEKNPVLFLIGFFHLCSIRVLLIWSFFLFFSDDFQSNCKICWAGDEYHNWIYHQSEKHLLMIYFDNYNWHLWILKFNKHCLTTKKKCQRSWEWEKGKKHFFLFWKIKQKFLKCFFRKRHFIWERKAC